MLNGEKELLSCTGKGIECSLPGGALVGAVVNVEGGMGVPLDDVDEREVLETEGDVLSVGLTASVEQ